MRKELNMFIIQGRIAESKGRWLARLNRIPGGRLPKEVCNTRLLDREVWEDLGTVDEVDIFSL